MSQTIQQIQQNNNELDHSFYVILLFYLVLIAFEIYMDLNFYLAIHKIIKVNANLSGYNLNPIIIKAIDQFDTRSKKPSHFTIL